MANAKSIDYPSTLGKFGWETIGPREELAVPVIIRSNNLRYSPVRIVEQEIIKKYDTLPQSVFNCITLKSFYITPNEAKLLNNINFNHSDNRYGETFFTTKDLIVSSADVKDLTKYLRVAHQVFNNEINQVSNKLGILRICTDPLNVNMTRYVPYMVKYYNGKPEKFIPANLVANYVLNSTSNVKAIPNDWDLTYLKMLCIYCKNNCQSYIARENFILLVDGLMYMKTNTPLISVVYTEQPRKTQ